MRLSDFVMITDWIGYHPVPLSNCFSAFLDVQKYWGLEPCYQNENLVLKECVYGSWEIFGVTEEVLKRRTLTADSALCRGILVAPWFFPGDMLSTGVLTADDKGKVGGRIPGGFLTEGGAILWVVLGGLLSGGTGVFRRTGKPSAHLL